MRIAVPLTEGRLSRRFSACESFALIDIDSKGRYIHRKDIEAMPEPDSIAPWLASQGVNLIISGGMRPAARGYFSDAGIRVIMGAHAAEPEKLVEDYLSGLLWVG